MVNPQKKAAAPAALGGEVKARLLVDSDLGKCNDVVLISAELVESLGDQVDTDPAAVEYAESIPKE